jgi:hypothetical protein
MAIKSASGKTYSSFADLERAVMSGDDRKEREAFAETMEREIDERRKTTTARGKAQLVEIDRYGQLEQSKAATEQRDLARLRMTGRDVSGGPVVREPTAKMKAATKLFETPVTTVADRTETQARRYYAAQRASTQVERDLIREREKETVEETVEKPKEPPKEPKWLGPTRGPGKLQIGGELAPGSLVTLYKPGFGGQNIPYIVEISSVDTYGGSGGVAGTIWNLNEDGTPGERHLQYIEFTREQVTTLSGFDNPSKTWEPPEQPLAQKVKAVGKVAKTSTAAYPNPWREDVRKGFAEKYVATSEYTSLVPIDWMPENVGEAIVARKWVGVVRQKTASLVQDTVGTAAVYSGEKLIAPAKPAGWYWTDPLTGEYTNAPSWMVAQLLQLEDVEAHIANVMMEDTKFRAAYASDIAEIQHKEDIALLEDTLARDLSTATTAAAWDNLNRTYEFEKGQADRDYMNRQGVLESEQAFEIALFDMETLTQQNRDKKRQEFDQEQNNLDRALRNREMNEVQRSSMAIEELKRDELNLDRQQFQIQVLTTLASSPQLLYFLNEMGGLGAFSDVLGQGLGKQLQDYFDRLSESPDFNIQEFSRLSSQQQGIQRWKTAATTGISPEAVDAELRGAGPMALQNRQALGQPVSPGASSFRPRSLSFSTGQ